MKKLSLTLLHLAERFFLFAHGWKRVGKDEYTPPMVGRYARPDKAGQLYRGGHAVNSQKYTNNSMRRLGRSLEEEAEA